MTPDEIDVMWAQALQHSMEDGEMFTRYYFAKMVAEYERSACAVHAVEIARRSVEEEREACAKIADEWTVGWPHPSTVIAERIRARGQA